jgi:hypothetical protein
MVRYVYRLVIILSINKLLKLILGFSSIFHQRKEVWDIPLERDIPFDLMCPITHEIFNEPVTLNGEVFERSDIIKWVKEHGTHPYSSKRAGLAQIEYCPEMKQLVDEFCKNNNFRKIKL